MSGWCNNPSLELALGTYQGTLTFDDGRTLGFQVRTEQHLGRYHLITHIAPEPCTVDCDRPRLRVAAGLAETARGEGEAVLFGFDIDDRGEIIHATTTLFRTRDDYQGRFASDGDPVVGGTLVLVRDP